MIRLFLKICNYKDLLYSACGCFVVVFFCFYLWRYWSNPSLVAGDL